MGKSESAISRRGFLAASAAAGGLIVGAGLLGCAPQGKGASASSGEEQAATYTGVGKGRGGDIVVKTTVAGGAIRSIDVVEHNESVVISDVPFTRMPSLVVKNQSMDIDVVTGATMTSQGLKSALEDSLEKAGIDPSSLAKTGKDKGFMSEEPIEADIGIVGGGLAGLTCAVRALELGKSVVVYEQSAHVGGSALFAHGWICGAGTLMQKAAGVEDSSEKFYDYIASQCEGGVPPYPAVTKAFTDTSGPAIDWLDTYVNVSFDKRQCTLGAYVPPDTARIYFTNGGHRMIYPLMKKINEAVQAGKASIVYETTVTGVVQDSSGTVTGVKTQSLAGKTGEYAHKAVILASGGYTANEAMLKEQNYVNIGTSAPSTSNGAGFAVAESAGAQLALMDQRATYEAGIPITGFNIKYKASTSYPGIMYVDKEGKRILNEGHPNALTKKRAWNVAKDNEVYLVFSEGQHIADKPLIIGTEGYIDHEPTPWESWGIFDDLVEQGEIAFSADSPEELAKKMGVDVAGFAATFAKYNEYAAAGTDPEFGNEAMQPLAGKLYALYTIPFVIQTCGGVLINEHAEALDASDKAIPGLYSCGEQSGMNMWCPPSHGGKSLGGAVIMGYVATNSAVGYIG